MTGKAEHHVYYVWNGVIKMETCFLEITPKDKELTYYTTRTMVDPDKYPVLSQAYPSHVSLVTAIKPQKGMVGVISCSYVKDECIEQLNQVT